MSVTASVIEEGFKTFMDVHYPTLPDWVNPEAFRAHMHKAYTSAVTTGCSEFFTNRIIAPELIFPLVSNNLDMGSGRELGTEIIDLCSFFFESKWASIPIPGTGEPHDPPSEDEDEDEDGDGDEDEDGDEEDRED
jgi:hypothetical protein